MYRMLAVAPLAVASLAVALVLSIPATSAQAAPLEAADVAAGAKWLVHIDFDAARDSKLGEHFIAKALETEHAKKGLEKLHDELGIDPRKDVHGATAYGTDFTRHTGVLVIYATADKEKLLSHLKSKPDFAESKSANGAHDVYSWTENMGKGDKHTVWASFPKAGVGVMAESARQFERGSRRARRQGRIVHQLIPIGRRSEGDDCSCRRRGDYHGEASIESPLAKQIDDVTLAIGEAEGDDFCPRQSEHDRRRRGQTDEVDDRWLPWHDRIAGGRPSGIAEDAERFESRSPGQSPVDRFESCVGRHHQGRRQNSPAASSVRAQAAAICRTARTGTVT